MREIKDLAEVRRRLGAAVSSARYRKKYSQEWMAEQVGISPMHMKNIEGGRKFPSFDVLITLLETSAFSLDDVVFGDAENEPLDLNGIPVKSANEIRRLVASMRLPSPGDEEEDGKPPAQRHQRRVSPRKSPASRKKEGAESPAAGASGPEGGKKQVQDGEPDSQDP